MLFIRFLIICFICFLGASEAYSSEFALLPQWLKLLHYQSKGAGYVSLVENEEFFISHKGRDNPISEYQATVEAFINPQNKQKCDFPARFLLLKKNGVVEGDLSSCEDYQKFLQDLQPKSVTMLFTDAYMSNPSSLFGHTLFRIDTKRQGTQLLAHGANFGADTGDDNGVLYALKGLWGGYYGTFGIKPYYDVINLYNNIENRDIWEYSLNLNDEELVLFTAHMWEMKQAKIRYYFASKNCSYVLLTMLEAVKPELELAEEFDGYVAPLATLKSVYAVSDLVGSVNYRPSRQSKLKHRLRQMNSRQKDVLHDIIYDENLDLNRLDDEEKADVLETAYQYIQYRYVEGELELADYRKKSFSLLRERSKIANERQYFDELHEGKNPVYAHEALRLEIGGGVKNGEFYQQVGFRPVYTSLLDDSYGLLKGAEINFFEVKARHYDKQDKYVLDDVNLLNITSLSGVDMLFSPVSYDIGVGIKRIFDAKTGQEHTAGQIELGVGQSYELAENTFLYLFTTPNGAYGSEFDDNGYYGVAFKAGVYYNLDNIRFNVSAMQNFTSNKTAYGQTYNAELAYGLTRNMAFYAEYKLFNSKYFDDEEIGSGVRFSF